MKSSIILSFIAIIIFYSCNNGGNASKETNVKTSDTATTTHTPVSNPDTKPNTSINEIVAAYLQLKNSLANDDGKGAATAGNAISETLKKIDAGALPAEQKKVYTDIADDLKENAEHIGANANKIAHQREHFEMLSKDLYDLVKTTKPNRILYKDFCPMYNDKKGAVWISETKEIKNPYMGKKMSTCGSVQEEIK